MTRRHTASITCPTAGCTAELDLIVSSGSDQGGWNDVELIDAPCGHDPDEDVLYRAVEDRRWAND